MASPRETRVLVADHDSGRRSAVCGAIAAAGMAVYEAGTAAETYRSTAGHGAAVVIVGDLDDARNAVLTQLRHMSTEIHLVVLGDDKDEDVRVSAFRAGADDFIARLPSLPELVARIEAAARRAGAPASRALEAGPLVIDVAGRTVLRDGEPVDLTRRELELLVHLASSPGRSFSRDELLEAVWSSSPEWQSRATVTEHVHRLRTKLEDDPSDPKLIVTVPGVGYRFGDATIGARLPAAGARDARHGDAMVIVEETTITWASPATVALLGAAAATEIVGREVFDFVALDSYGAVRARHDHAREGAWPRPEVVTLLRLDGATVDVEMTSTPVTYEGRPASQVMVWPVESGDAIRLGVTGVSHDVADAVVICDHRGVIRSFNPAAETLYGWRESEVIGRSVIETIVSPEDSSFAEADAALRSDGRWHGESVHRRRDGRPVPVRATATVIRDDEGAPVGLIAVNREVAACVPRAAFDETAAADLRRGIAAGELTVHYQPIIDIVDAAVLGVEALVRWQHPGRGLLEPAAFMDVAEESGLVSDVDTFVLERACAQWAAWRAAGRPLNMGVNVSARSLDDGIVERVTSAMERYGIVAGALWLEVTETSLIEDVERAGSALQRLEELGARIAIDDFGTGWASLTYLHQFPVHALKIDSLFVRGMEHSANDLVIVRSILGLGADLGLEVVAEGVETSSQLAILRELGCQLAQGYLLARPVTATLVDTSRRSPRVA